MFFENINMTYPVEKHGVLYIKHLHVNEVFQEILDKISKIYLIKF